MAAFEAIARFLGCFRGFRILIIASANTLNNVKQKPFAFVRKTCGNLLKCVWHLPHLLKLHFGEVMKFFLDWNVRRKSHHQKNKANENYPPNLQSDVCIYLLAANHSESLTAIVAARKISAELNSIVSFSKHENANWIKFLDLIRSALFHRWREMWKHK